jgi:hypothetical protein
VPAVHFRSQEGIMINETRTYVEQKPNGVQAITTIVTDNDGGEIRYSVTKDGVIIFNKAVEGHYSYRLALELSRAQEQCANEAAR